MEKRKKAMSNDTYHVVIAGAGMVGATLACALGNSDLRVAVLEVMPPEMSWPNNSVDMRVSAVSHASEQIFRAVNAWQGMVDRRVSAYSEMHVWDSTGNGVIHFDSADIGEPNMGHIIENRVVRAALLERMEAFDNIELLCPASISKYDVDDRSVIMELADGRRISAALLVGADGGRSKVRALAHINTTGWSYDQMGVVTTAATELPHGRTAWQRFLPSGPLAFLPLADGRCSVVWSTTTDHARALLAMNDNEFSLRLAEAFAGKLGRVVGVSPRAAFPLRLQHAERYVQSRVALVGDAAHAIHPLAGQGANLGVLDSATLAEVVRDAADLGKDIGSLQVLRRYERWRKGNNLLMMYTMDGFKRFFGNTIGVMRRTRNFGLNLSDRVTPVKHAFMRHAMGLDGDLPKLAQGTAL